jgi:hypothetical protein
MPTSERETRPTSQSRPARSPKGARALIGVGLLILFLAFGWGAWRDFRPVSIPIQVQPGVTRTPPIWSDCGQELEVKLSVDQSMDSDSLNCLLGIASMFGDTCPGIPPVIDMSWRAYRSDRLVASGGSSGRAEGFWGSDIGRMLGTFPATMGESYVVELVSHRSIGPLQRAHPKLVVSGTGPEIEGIMVMEGMAFGVSVLLMLVGAIWLIGSRVRQRLAARR